MRQAFGLFVLVFALALLPAGTAFAAEGHGGGGVNIFEWALDLGIWTLVVFLLLVFVLGKYAWKPMLEGLRQREINIRAAIDEAHKTQEEARRLQDVLTTERNQAAQRVKEMMDAARRDAEQVKSEMVASAKTEIQTERDRLRKEIETAKDQALSEIWRQSVDLAALISSKAVRKQLTITDHAGLIDEAIAELPQAVSERTKFLAGERS